MNRLKFLFVFVALMSVGHVFANSYKAELMVKVATNSTGMGLVYASDSTDISEEEDDMFELDSIYVNDGANAGGELKTFYAYAKTVDDEAYEFLGWSETDGGAIVSIQNPYSVTIPTALDAGKTNRVTVFANFLEKKLSSLSFVPTENGHFVATDSETTINDSGSLSTRNKVYLSATPSDGYKVMGWYTIDDSKVKSYFSFDATTERTFSEDTKVGVDFVEQTTPVFFIKDNDSAYTNLAVALNDVKSGDVIILVSGGVLQKGDYVLPAGVTLLVPHNKQFTVYNETFRPYVSKEYVLPSVYETLTMEDGASLRVDGVLNISSNMHAINNRTQLPGGGPSGEYGHIDMMEGSEIILNNGAVMYTWGYITGNGHVAANEGSTVYEGFQMTEFRGGTTLANLSGNEYKIFPFNQYYIQNVEVPMTIYYGAQEKVVTAMFADGKAASTDPFLFIGTDGMFVLAEGSYVTKRYDSQRDRQIYELNGDARFGSIMLSMSGIVVMSDEYVLPLTNNLSITINSGTLTIDKPNGIALLSGAEMTIGKNAVLSINNSKMYVYDGDVWGKFSGFYSFVPTYSPTMAYERTSLSDAILDIQGKVVVNNGYLYTTEGGANVCCTEGRGELHLGNGELENVTYQVEQKSYDLTFVPIAITPAVLKNSDEFAGTDQAFTSTETSQSGTIFYYHQETGMWDTDQVTSVDVIDAPNASVNAIYGLDGIKKTQLNRGVNIVKYNDGSLRKLIK